MSQSEKSEDLFGRTWKTVVVLVGACIVFVGTLSGAAVLITSRALDPHPSSSSSSTSDSDDAKADAKPGPKSGVKPIPTAGAKKPVSI